MNDINYLLNKILLSLLKRSVLWLLGSVLTIWHDMNTAIINLYFLYLSTGYHLLIIDYLPLVFFKIPFMALSWSVWFVLFCALFSFVLKWLESFIEEDMNCLCIFHPCRFVQIWNISNLNVSMIFMTKLRYFPPWLYFRRFVSNTTNLMDLSQVSNESDIWTLVQTFLTFNKHNLFLMHRHNTDWFSRHSWMFVGIQAFAALVILILFSKSVNAIEKQMWRLTMFGPLIWKERKLYCSFILFCVLFISIFKSAFLLAFLSASWYYMNANNLAIMRKHIESTAS